jgi:septal ring factor EnvC (AmiA/AmiB activator)
MPTPTDQLADAIERLEGSIDRLNARIDRLDETIRGMGQEFAEFRGSVKTQLAAIRWFGVFFAGILVAIAVGAGRVVWDASALTSKVEQFSKDSSALTGEVKQLSNVSSALTSGVEQLSKDSSALTGEVKQLSNVSSALTGKVEQLSSRVERLEGRLETWAEKMSKQLDVLIQHTQREPPKRPQGGSPAPAD